MGTTPPRHPAAHYIGLMAAIAHDGMAQAPDDAVPAATVADIVEKIFSTQTCTDILFCLHQEVDCLPSDTDKACAIDVRPTSTIGTLLLRAYGPPNESVVPARYDPSLSEDAYAAWEDDILRPFLLGLVNGEKTKIV